MPPYPSALCNVPPGCASGATAKDLAHARLPAGLLLNPGLVWLTQTDVRRLATVPNLLSYVVN